MPWTNSRGHVIRRLPGSTETRLSQTLAAFLTEFDYDLAFRPPTRRDEFAIETADGIHIGTVMYYNAELCGGIGRVRHDHRPSQLSRSRIWPQRPRPHSFASPGRRTRSVPSTFTPSPGTSAPSAASAAAGLHRCANPAERRAFRPDGGSPRMVAAQDSERGIGFRSKRPSVTPPPGRLCPVVNSNRPVTRRFAFVHRNKS